LKWSVTWLVNLDPSEPRPRTVMVKVVFCVVPFWLKLPQTVNEPV
jgi:hypothetical protein